MAHQNKLFLRNYNDTLNLSVITFASFLIIVAAQGYKETFASFMIPMQISVGICYFGCLYFSARIKNCRQLLICILGYNLVFSFLFRIIFINYYNAPYGLAVDSYTYDYIGHKAEYNSISRMINYISAFWDIDDFGYSIFTMLIFKGFGAETARWIVLFLNSVFITISSYLLYRIGLMLFNNKKISIICSALWGYFPFMFITASVGLKENVFCTVIMAFWFFVYKFYAHRTIGNIIWVIIFLTLTFAFRKAITLMLLFSFILLCIINENNKKKIVLVIILGGILAPFCASYAIEAFTGVSMEKIMAVTEGRNATMGTETPGPMVQMVAALFGPFPNFNRLVSYGLYYSSGLLFKSLTSIFCLTGLYYVGKYFDFKFYPIALYLIFGIAMLILGGVALDMRYAITFYMAFIVFLCYGMTRLKNRIPIMCCQALCLTVIMFYNLR